MASNATSPIDAGVDAGIVHAAEPLHDELVSKLPVLEEIAADLWSADYGSLFANEIERNRALVSHHAGTLCCTSSQLQLSSYARRLSGHPRHSNVIQYMLDQLRKNRLIHTMSHMATLSSTVKDMF